MATLGIFTVKLLHRHGGEYWTYGGFGDYLAAVRRHFRHVVLFAHVRESAPGPGFYRLPPEGLEVIALPWVRGELQALLAVPRVWSIARRAITRVDIVHARMPDYTGVVGALLAGRHGIPYFIQIIADWAIQAQSVPWHKRFGLGALLKAHLKLYDRIERRVCANQLVFAQGESAFEKHRRSADAHLVASSAHHDFDIVTARRRFTGKPYHLLNVARLDSVKNQRLILRALSILNADGPTWTATFVGAGDQLAALRMEARQLGLEQHVTFAGMVGRGASLWAYFDAADVFVLSSRSEGTPKVILEAMARAVPVVATRVGGVPSVVKHRVNGLLIDDNSVDDLVAALCDLATVPGLPGCLVANGLVTAAERTVEAETARMIDVVRSRWPHLSLCAPDCDGPVPV